MPRRSSRISKAAAASEPEKKQTKLTAKPKEPPRKKAKVEKEVEKPKKKHEADEVQEDDDFDFEGLLETLSPKKKSTRSPKKTGFADSTQDDFIKMLQDFKKEDEKLQEARSTYKKNEDKSLCLEDLDASVEIETTTREFVLLPPVLFDTEIDVDTRAERCDLQQVIKRNNIEYKSLLEKHPYFIGFDTKVIPLPTQEDLVASGFMQTMLQRNPVNSIPPFIFDWLFNLTCFSRNRSIPGTAFRTVASIVSFQPFSVEIDTLSPDLSVIDSLDEQGECYWSISFSTFVDVLILKGANPEKFGREREKDDEDDSDEDMSDTEGDKKEGEGATKEEAPVQPVFSPLHLYQLDLFLQLAGLTITASKYKKDHSDLPRFLRACVMLLLDPIGQNAQGSILYTILRVLHAFPKFTEEECLSICGEILSENVFPHHQHWVKLAQFLPITTRRAKLFKNSIAYCGVSLLILGNLPSSLFQSSLPVHGKNGTLGLFSVVERRYNAANMNEEGGGDLARELLSVLELFDLCIDKKEVVVMAGVASKREKVLEDYRVLTKSIDHFRHTIHDDLFCPEKMFVKEVLARISQTLGDLLEYLGFEGKEKAGLKQTLLTDAFK